MTCVKISFRNRATEIDKLKNYHISAWRGRRQKFLIVTIENEGKKENKEFEFKLVRDYSWFINQLRRLENNGSS